MAGLAAIFLLWGLNRDPDSLGGGGPPPWLSPETLGALGTIAALARYVLGRVPPNPLERAARNRETPAHPARRTPSRKRRARLGVDGVVDKLQRWIDAYIRSAATQATTAFNDNLDPVETRHMVRQAECGIAVEILGAFEIGSRKNGSAPFDERYHGFASLFLDGAETRGLMSPQDVLGVRRFEALAIELSEDETRDLETENLDALEEAIGKGELEASPTRTLGEHSGVAPGSTAERLRRVACHLHLAAVAARCRSGVYVGLMDMGFEVWMDRPESDRDEDLARCGEDDAAIYDLWRDWGMVVLLTQSDAEQRQALARWVSVHGQFSAP